jgi:hypothetical protein
MRACSDKSVEAVDALPFAITLRQTPGAKAGTSLPDTIFTAGTK